MKTKSFCTLALGALLALTAAQPAFADTPAKASRYGAELRKAQVSGYTLTYFLIDIAEMNATSVMPRTSSEGAQQTKAYHLMVFVNRPDGRPVTEGKAGFRVVQANKSEAKEMAVPMDGGFGSDVELPFHGDYTITTKLVLADADLVDTFVYTLK